MDKVLCHSCIVQLICHHLGELRWVLRFACSHHTIDKQVLRCYPELVYLRALPPPARDSATGEVLAGHRLHIRLQRFCFPKECCPSVMVWRWYCTAVMQPHLDKYYALQTGDLDARLFNLVGSLIRTRRFHLLHELLGLATEWNRCVRDRRVPLFDCHIPEVHFIWGLVAVEAITHNSLKLWNEAIQEMRKYYRSDDVYPVEWFVQARPEENDYISVSTATWRVYTIWYTTYFRQRMNGAITTDTQAWYLRIHSAL